MELAANAREAIVSPGHCTGLQPAASRTPPPSPPSLGASKRRELDVPNAIILVASVVAALAALDQRRDEQRYVDFLKRIHTEAADFQARPDKGYFSPFYPVNVEEDEIDLAFRALAQDLLLVEQDGTWSARPVRFRRAG